MSLGEAVEVFTKLTIGDGLVSQVPAFLISLAAGLIVTRSSSETDLGRDVTGQLFRRPEVLGCRRVPGPDGLLGAAEAPLLTLAAAPGGGGLRAPGRPDPVEASVPEPPRVAPTTPRDASNRPRSRRRQARLRPRHPAHRHPSLPRSALTTCCGSIRWSWRSATG